MLRAPNTTGILKGVNALKRTKKEQHDARFIFLMLFPALLVPICMTYYPMFKGIVMAFQNYKLTNINNIYWNNFANFKQLFTRSITNEFYGTMKNTLIWVVVSLAFQFLVGFGLALVLKKKFRGSSLYQGLVFFPWAVSGFVIALIWRWMFNGTSGVFNDMLMRMGLIGEPVGWLAGKNTAMLCCVITNIWYGVPFFTIMISAALRGIDPGLYEAAEVDGANPLEILGHHCTQHQPGVKTHPAFACNLDFQLCRDYLHHDKGRPLRLNRNHYNPDDEVHRFL